MNLWVGRNYPGAYLNHLGNAVRQNDSSTNAAKSEDINALKRMLKSDTRSGAKNKTVDANGKIVFTGSSQNSVVNSAMNYADALKAQKAKTKENSLAVKKLRYDFKGISSKIVRSKTSQMARQVASQARREVMRLKRQQGQDADDEELQAAITHAKTMERVAKKKVMHLEQEEMAERTRKAKEFEENQSAKTADISILSDEDEKAENTDLSEAKLPEGKLLEGRLSGTELSETELSEAELSEIEISEAEYEDAFDMMEAVSNLEELGAEFLEELGNELSEAQMEEMGLSDFSDSAKAARGDMSSEDLKLLKVKHRNKEMKEIVKADAEYLKVVFDKLQAESSADKVNVEPQNISPDMSGSIAGGMTGSIPGETISAAFDISI